MNYLRAKQQKNRTIFISIFSIAVLCLVIFFHKPIGHAGKAVFQTVASPFWKANIAIRDKFAAAILSRSSKRTLSERIFLLESQLAEADQKLVVYNALKADYDEFKNLPKSPQNIVSAIILRSPVASRDTIVLGAGSNDGVKIGQEVWIGDNLAAGTISEVFSGKSIAKLYSFSGLETEAIVAETKLAVTLVGRGGGNFEIILPKGAELSSGMSLVLTKNETIVVGVIGAEISDERDPFAKYLARLSFNPNQVRFVSISKN